MPHSVRHLRDVAASRIGGDEARLEVDLVLAHALGVSRAWLFAHPEFELDTPTRERFERLVAARTAGRPIAYLLGRREFFGLDLEITPDVLIPRADTEVLVEQALARIAHDVNFTMADLGTGSGAIALAIANARPRAHVTATDASAAALAVAQANAQRLGIANIQFAQGDWCAAFGDQRFDMIVSNPPYIADDDVHLDCGDLRFEPRAALASGVDGLDAIRSIVSGVDRYLPDSGSLLLEHGCAQGDAIRLLLSEQGFSDIETICDIEHRERVTAAVRQR